MRVFKIRVWDVKDDEWFYTAQGRPEDHNVLSTYYFEQLYQDEEDYIWEQYTGLKDKNGKEIYEGDIVKFDCGDQTPAEVVYQAGSYFLKATDDGSLFYDPETDKPCPLGWFETWGLEVIGNVHENPDLLEKNK